MRPSRPPCSTAVFAVAGTDRAHTTRRKSAHSVRGETPGEDILPAQEASSSPALTLHYPRQRDRIQQRYFHTTNRLSTGHICLSSTYHLQITFRSSTYHLHIIHRPSIYHRQTIYMSSTDHLQFSSTGHLRIICMPSTVHLQITYR